MKVLKQSTESAIRVGSVQQVSPIVVFPRYCIQDIPAWADEEDVIVAMMRGELCNSDIHRYVLSIGGLLQFTGLFRAYISINEPLHKGDFIASGEPERLDRGKAYRRVQEAASAADIAIIEG